MFNPSRLILARKRQRLTCKELAVLINVSPVTITRIEKGHNEPDIETLKAIISALGFPKEFYFGDDIDQLTKDSASFRSLSSMSAKERDAALAAGSLAYLFSDWITEKFNLPATDLLDLKYERNAAGAARTLRDYWGLGEKPISHMIKLLESKGVKVFSLSENNKNVDAFSCWRNDTPYIFLNVFKSAEHSRFDAAHELGHLVLHKHEGFRQKEIEIEANNFASSFLMPEADVISNISFVTSLDQVMEAKKRWKVSIAALSYRLHKIGILSDWQYRNFCIQINMRGYRTNEPNEIEREESIIWKKIFHDLWSDRITKNHIASDLSIPCHELESFIFGSTMMNNINKLNIHHKISLKAI